MKRYIVGLILLTAFAPLIGNAALLEGDLNGDGKVNQYDLDFFPEFLQTTVGNCGYNEAADFDDSGLIDGADFDALFQLVQSASDTDPIGPVISPSLRGDLNGDERVNKYDLDFFPAFLQTSTTSPNWNPIADLVDDDLVDGADFDALFLLVSEGANDTLDCENTGGNPGPTATSTIEILPLTLPNGEVGENYNEHLTASTTSSGPFTWTVATGTLPTGLDLNDHSGVISGHPTVVGTSTFTVSVTDGTISATREYTIVIAEEQSHGKGSSGGSSSTGGSVGAGGSFGLTSGQVLGTSTPQGEVLGDEISCGKYLTTYLRQGQANNSAEVTRLQSFLNAELNISLPMTGFFGPLTHNAVNNFQLKYKEQILRPWVAFGLPNENTPTGYVYKTTSYAINKKMCAELDLPAPILP